ncbi:hypothetical protein NIES4075_69350 [Tolypothrix sp. NIES-4075]|nr:hypothetical protein NIES4075_69350 [Tolypothrix sp. NIES-4075]
MIDSNRQKKLNKIDKLFKKLDKKLNQIIRQCAIAKREVRSADRNQELEAEVSRLKKILEQAEQLTSAPTTTKPDLFTLRFAHSQNPSYRAAGGGNC